MWEYHANFEKNAFARPLGFSVPLLFTALGCNIHHDYPIWHKLHFYLIWRLSSICMNRRNLPFSNDNFFGESMVNQSSTTRSWEKDSTKTHTLDCLLVPPGLLIGQVFKAYLSLGHCHFTKCLDPKKLVPNEWYGSNISNDTPFVIVSQVMTQSPRKIGLKNLSYQ